MHGIQLPGRNTTSHTRAVVQSLTNRTFNAHADTIDNFFYDVYSVYFGGEGGVFHASKLFAQAKFIASSVKIIAEGCWKNIEEITIVAHSVGGWLLAWLLSH